MRSRGVNSKCRQARLRPVYLGVASLAVLIAAGGDAGARGGERPIKSVATRSAGEPLMAIVSLRDQRITVYDAKGWILRAPVSSGSKGRETPAGIFSVIQKVEDHYSNLYDDATCRTCNASPGQASRFMAASCRGVRRPTAVSGCHSTSPNACSTRPRWACG